MGPFAGLRVRNLLPSRVGAQVSRRLADFGAEVSQIELPGVLAGQHTDAIAAELGKLVADDAELRQRKVVGLTT